MNEKRKINETIALLLQEIRFTFSCSSMPGGQNVNKVNTRATLLFDVVHSSNLTASQKQKIVTTLQSRINRNGVLRVVSYRHRTQGANKRAATERFGDLIQDALKNIAPRQKTGIPRSSREKRILSKKQRTITKQFRNKIKF